MRAGSPEPAVAVVPSTVALHARDQRGERERAKHETELSMRQRAKNERARSKHERELSTREPSMRERAEDESKHERGSNLSMRAS